MTPLCYLCWKKGKKSIFEISIKSFFETASQNKRTSDQRNSLRVVITVVHSFPQKLFLLLLASGALRVIRFLHQGYTGYEK